MPSEALTRNLVVVAQTKEVMNVITQSAMAKNSVTDPLIGRTGIQAGSGLPKPEIQTRPCYKLQDKVPNSRGSLYCEKL